MAGYQVFFNGKFVPYGDAKVGIMTHALHYGTGCFEGIRGYWNAEKEQLFIFRVDDHYRRIHNSAHLLLISIPYSVDELCQITIELLQRNNFREDVYIRPIAYKSTETIGVRLHSLDDGFAIYAFPFGKYLESMEKGVRCRVSSWRRVDDNSIPARAKITGAYVNGALAKTEAQQDGFDEAIVLTQDGHVSEGSGENIFLVVGGQLCTPAVSENILVGITRSTIIHIAKEEYGLSTVERCIDRSELYGADECFLTGTGAEISPVVEIDRRKIGSGTIGPISAQLQKLYFEIVRGNKDKYISWCRPVYPK